MSLSKKPKLQIPRVARDDNKKAGAYASRNHTPVWGADALWITDALAPYKLDSIGRKLDALVGEVRLRVAALIADVDAPENSRTRKRTAGQLVGLLELIVREPGDHGKIVFKHTLKQLNHSGFLKGRARGHAPRIVRVDASLPI